MGFYINTLVLRSQLGAEDSFVDYLRKVQVVLLEAISNSDYPFNHLVENLPLQRERSRNPLFDVLVEYIEARFDAQRNFYLEGLEINSLEVESGTSKFDLSFYFIERKEGLELLLEYNTDLFLSSTIENYAAYFVQLLHKILATSSGKNFLQLIY